MLVSLVLVAVIAATVVFGRQIVHRRTPPGPMPLRIYRLVTHPLRCVVCATPLCDGEYIVTNDIQTAHLKCVAKVRGWVQPSQAPRHVLNVVLTQVEWDVMVGKS